MATKASVNAVSLPAELPTIPSVVGIDRVLRRFPSGQGLVEIEFLPLMRTVDGTAIHQYMQEVLAGDAILEPERLAAALADALQAALQPLQVRVVVQYRDTVRVEATRGV